MTQQTKRALVRAAWVFVFSGIGALVTVCATLSPDEILSLNWRLLIGSVVAGGFAGLKKYYDWTEVPPLPEN